MKKTKTQLECKLKVGAKVKIGKRYAAKSNGAFREGEILTLVEGEFEYENGQGCSFETAPAIYDEQMQEWDSIYHLFGNDLEDFMDCTVLSLS